MKTIRIFLASSEEMDYDRMVFGNLIRRLDDVYEKRGIRLKVFEWEDYDAAFNDRRKQDEYNENVRKSDIFLALFHKKAGQFTIEEFDVASEAFKEKASPKVYAYLKDLKPGEEASPELEDFKHRLFDEMGHYWCRYDNRDSLQFQFVMQLQLVENAMGDNLTVENGEVNLDGLKVASMDRLQFAAGNENYVKMSEDLVTLPQKIEKARLRFEKFPDDEDLLEDLQQKIDRYNKLKEEFSEYQTILFDTAKRIARLQGERITERMRRAMDAFNEGKVKDANIILNEAEADARRNLEDYKQSREITEQKRQNVIWSLEELLLKVSTVLADASISIDDRVELVDKIYSQADSITQEVKYEHYVEFLSEYGGFLRKYAKYDKALKNYLKASSCLEHSKDVFHLVRLAQCYDDIGGVYHEKGDYSAALAYLTDALTLRKQTLGENNIDTAQSYNNLGLLFIDMGNYEKAKLFLQNSLDKDIALLGDNHEDTATTYNNLGLLYLDLGDYDSAIDYLKHSLLIRERVLDKQHPNLAASYNNLGAVYYAWAKYDKALLYFEKSLTSLLEIFGTLHPNTATCYFNIGCIYSAQRNIPKATECFNITLKIRERVFGYEHPATVAIKNEIINLIKDC